MRSFLHWNEPEIAIFSSATRVSKKLELDDCVVNCWDRFESSEMCEGFGEVLFEH